MAFFMIVGRQHFMTFIHSMSGVRFAHISRKHPTKSYSNFHACCYTFFIFRHRLSQCVNIPFDRVQTKFYELDGRRNVTIQIAILSIMSRAWVHRQVEITWWEPIRHEMKWFYSNHKNEHMTRIYVASPLGLKFPKEYSVVTEQRTQAQSLSIAEACKLWAWVWPFVKRKSLSGILAHNRLRMLSTQCETAARNALEARVTRDKRKIKNARMVGEQMRRMTGDKMWSKFEHYFILSVSERIESQCLQESDTSLTYFERFSFRVTYECRLIVAGSSIKTS